VIHTGALELEDLSSLVDTEALPPLLVVEVWSGSSSVEVVFGLSSTEEEDDAALSSEVEVVFGLSSVVVEVDEVVDLGLSSVDEDEEDVDLGLSSVVVEDEEVDFGFSSVVLDEDEEEDVEEDLEVLSSDLCNDD
jgi:hypothetical protein